MKEIMKINIQDINPYVRLVQKIRGTSEDFYVPWRIIYDFELMFIIDGTFILRTLEQTIELHKGDFIIIPPFLRHKQEIPKGCDCEYFGAHMDFYSDGDSDFSYNDLYIKPCDERYEIGIEDEKLNERQVYEPNNVDLKINFHITDYLSVYQTFSDMYDAYIKGTDISNLKLRAYAILLLSSIFKEIDEKEEELNNENIMVNKLSEYVSRHFSERIEFVEIAQSYGFSPSYFRKIFKQITKTAPNAYLINIRIEEAKKLLKLNKYSVQTIGEMVGYDDVHYFTRLFKKKEGITPAEYAKRCKKAQK